MRVKGESVLIEGKFRALYIDSGGEYIKIKNKKLYIKDYLNNWEFGNL